MCSFRSCPTQNARPVPVSTPRAPRRPRRPPDACRAAATLARCSSAFIASGRFSVMVATPSAKVVRDGVTHRGSSSTVGEDSVRSGSRRRNARPRGSSRSLSASKNAAARSPAQSSGSSSGGRPGSRNRNLRHSCTSPDRTANACSSSGSGPADRHQRLGLDQPGVYDAPAPPVPGPADEPDRVAVVPARGTAPRATPSTLEQLVHLGVLRSPTQVASASGAQPRKASRLAAARGGCARLGQVGDHEVPACRPSRRARRPVDPGGRVVEPPTRPRRQRVAGAVRSRTGSSQPCRTIRDTAVRTAGAATPSGASSRTRAGHRRAAPPRGAGGRRTGRTGPNGRSRRAVSLVAVGRAVGIPASDAQLRFARRRFAG